MFNKFEVKLRKCKGSDYVFVYNLSKKNMKKYVDKYWGGWKPEKFKKNFNKNIANTVIAEYHSKRIGFYALDIRDKKIHINDVQIIKNHRGKGLGTYLMKLIEKKALSRGIRKLELQVFKDNPAKRLYSRLGYKKIKDKKSAIIMEKRLK